MSENICEFAAKIGAGPGHIALLVGGGDADEGAVFLSFGAKIEPFLQIDLCFGQRSIFGAVGTERAAQFCVDTDRTAGAAGNGQLAALDGNGYDLRTGGSVEVTLFQRVKHIVVAQFICGNLQPAAACGFGFVDVIGGEGEQRLSCVKHFLVDPFIVLCVADADAFVVVDFHTPNAFQIDVIFFGLHRPGGMVQRNEPALLFGGADEAVDEFGTVDAVFFAVVLNFSLAAGPAVAHIAAVKADVAGVFGITGEKIHVVAFVRDLAVTVGGRIHCQLIGGDGEEILPGQLRMGCADLVVGESHDLIAERGIKITNLFRGQLAVGKDGVGMHIGFVEIFGGGEEQLLHKNILFLPLRLFLKF